MNLLKPRHNYATQEPQFQLQVTDATMAVSQLIASTFISVQTDAGTSDTCHTSPLQQGCAYAANALKLETVAQRK